MKLRFDSKEYDEKKQKDTTKVDNHEVLLHQQSGEIVSWKRELICDRFAFSKYN